MKKVMGMGAIAVLVTLAIVWGQRMDYNAMAVIIGVAFGVMAAIPTGLIVSDAQNQSAPVDGQWRLLPDEDAGGISLPVRRSLPVQSKLSGEVQHV